MGEDFRKYFATDSFGSSEEQRNIFSLISGCGEAGGGLPVAKVFLVLKISVTEGDESQDLACLQYMEMTWLLDMVEKVLG